MDATINEAFVRTGTAHFLAASGMHVGWLALMAWWLTRLVGLHYRRCAIVVALVILAYMILAEPRPAILRAGILGILACWSIYPRGKINAINWLSASAIIILMLTPAALFRPAFYFSFVAIISIIFLTPRISTALNRYVAPFRSLDRRNVVRDAAVHLPLEPSLPSQRRIAIDTVLRSVRLMLAVSLAAWIGNVPLACYHFNQFSPFGSIFTMLLWTPAFVVTALGFAKLTVGLLLPSIASLIDPALHAANSTFVAAVELCARIPIAVVSGNSPSLILVVCVYAAIAVYAIRQSLLSRRAWCIVALIFAVWWLIPIRWVRADRGALNVWMIAVGDGTGTVIELPDGRTMLFDFGTRTPFDVARVADSFFVERGIDEIDTVFVSHANFDHYGAIEFILRETPIGRVELSDQFERFVSEKDGAWYFLNALRDAGVDIKKHHGPKQWTDPSGVEFELLWPPSQAARPAPNANDSSLALRLTFQNKSILLTGDQAEWGLGGLIAAGNIRADVLALPHHGSVVHNTAKFIVAVDPTVAVRSTGQSKSKTNNGIESLVGDSCAYFSTADNGCVRIRIFNGKIEASSTIE